MIKKLFFRCNGGHYFQGASCPFDAWTMDGVPNAVALFEDLSRDRKDLTLEAMKAMHPAPTLLERMLIIEFGAEASIFDAVAPERYIYRGQELLWRDTDESLN